jgi:hypothetical protein
LRSYQFRRRRIDSVRLRELYDHTVASVWNDESLTPRWMFVTLAHHCQSQGFDICNRASEVGDRERQVMRAFPMLGKVAIKEATRAGFHQFQPRSRIGVADVEQQIPELCEHFAEDRSRSKVGA